MTLKEYKRVYNKLEVTPLEEGQYLYNCPQCNKSMIISRQQLDRMIHDNRQHLYVCDRCLKIIKDNPESKTFAQEVIYE